MLTDNEITYEVRGAIYDVYKTLGPGLLESVYEEALSFELQKRGLRVDRQVEVPIVYDGNVLKTPLRLDIMVEQRIIVELKSVEELQKVHYKQLMTYLRLMDKHVGLLVNFNCNEILSNIKRVVN
jgi:GxxExxY protein